MLTIFVRSVLLYGAAVLALRLMGKRQVGQLQPFELAVVIMIAELAATPMGSMGIPLLYGVVPIMALLMCHGLLTWLGGRSPRIDAVISGEPTVLIRDGQICEDALRKMGLSMTDLLEAVRLGGQLDVSQVSTAVMEPSGQITVFPKAAFRPVTPQDLQLHCPQESLPLPIILDGRLHQGNLRHAGLTEENVKRLLTERGAGTVKDVLLLLRTSDGAYYLQPKAERTKEA